MTVPGARGAGALRPEGRPDPSAPRGRRPRLSRLFRHARRAAAGLLVLLAAGFLAAPAAAQTAPTAAVVPGAAFGEAVVGWTAVAQVNGQATEGYEVRWRAEDQDWSFTRSAFIRLPAADLAYTLTGLSAGTYHFRVRGTRGETHGVAGQWSNTVSLTFTTSAPHAPTGLTVERTGGGGVRLGWTAPANDGGSPIAGYVWQYENLENANFEWSANFMVGAGVTEVTRNFGAEAAAHARRFRVRARNGIGAGPFAVVTLPAATVPGVPGNLGFVRSDPSGNVKAVRISWEAPASDGNSPITHYHYRSRGQGSVPTNPVTINGLSRTGVTPLNSRVQFQVRACNGVLAAA